MHMTNENITSVPGFYGYTGRQFDSESGLYYDRARPYNPATGRFNNTDPSGLSGGDYNLYRYVGNNPLAYVDPNGLAGIGIIGSAGGGAGAIGGVQGSGSTGVLFGTTDGGIQSTGITIVEIPSTNQTVIGGSIGGGGSLVFYTGSVEQYSGTAQTADIVLGPVSISISGGSQGGLFLSVGTGKGGGFEVAVTNSSTTLYNSSGSPINSCPR
jgi:RHS repeat-associated protein